jgi:hypothetical protein
LGSAAAPLKALKIKPMQIADDATCLSVFFILSNPFAPSEERYPGFGRRKKIGFRIVSNANCRPSCELSVKMGT